MGPGWGCGAGSRRRDSTSECHLVPVFCLPPVLTRPCPRLLPLSPCPYAPHSCYSCPRIFAPFVFAPSSFSILRTLRLSSFSSLTFVLLLVFQSLSPYAPGRGGGLWGSCLYAFPRSFLRIGEGWPAHPGSGGWQPACSSESCSCPHSPWGPG